MRGRWNTWLAPRAPSSAVCGGVETTRMWTKLFTEEVEGYAKMRGGAQGPTSKEPALVTR